MPIYKPTELKPFLRSLGVHPKKGLSQNFLIDGNIIDKILATASVAPGDVVVEVGPGPGALTEALLAAGATVIAVELDRPLAEALSRFPHKEGQLHVHCGDILKVTVDELLADKLPTGAKAKVVANLPYHLTSPIIEKFVTRSDLFSSLTFMVQNEVAQRLTAQPKTKAYSSFTVFLQVYADVETAFVVQKGSFYPAPDVDSAVVAFRLHPPVSIADLESFFVLTRSSFEQRRKMMRASLRKLYLPQQVEEALKAIGCSPLARPEELSLQQFMQLHDALLR